MSRLKQRPSLLGRLMGQTDDSSSSNSSLAYDDELPPLSPLTLSGYKETTKHRLMTEPLANNIRNLIPPRLQLYDNWHLIYSIEQHGISLNTLYRNCDPEHQLELQKLKKLERGYGDSIVRSMINDRDDRKRRPIGYVLIIRDSKNNKFGCYLNEHLRSMEHKRYYGNGECFLWKTEHGSHEYGPHDRFKAFMYTGINDNIVYSNSQFIAIGSSDGKNGLWISLTLEEGISYECETFGNEVLNGHRDKSSSKSDFGKFKIRGLEIWRLGCLQ